LRHGWTDRKRITLQRDTIRGIKHASVIQAIWLPAMWRCCGPSIHLRGWNPYESTGHVQPPELPVIRHRPLHAIARKSVEAGERIPPAVFETTHPAGRRRPEDPLFL